MINVGEHCIYCNQSVAWGSGLYVNRIPADDGEKTGFMCAVCVEEAEELADECRERMEDIVESGEKFTDIQIQNHYEAFRMGLWLDVTAPTDAQASDVLRMTESFAGHLSDDEIERAKAEVESLLKEEISQCQ